MSAIAYILISILLNISGQVSLKVGVNNLGEIKFIGHQVFSEIFRVFTNLHVLGGLFFYGISTIFWLMALSKSDLSFAYPFLSIGYILVLAASYFILGESITFARVAGVVLIVVGLLIISTTK